MSQAKVEQYKKEKANRKKILAREKRFHVYRISGIVVVLVAIIAWAGFSGYNAYEAKKPAETFHVSTDSLTDYLTGLSTEE